MLAAPVTVDSAEVTRTALRWCASIHWRQLNAARLHVESAVVAKLQRSKAIRAEQLGGIERECD